VDHLWLLIISKDRTFNLNNQYKFNNYIFNSATHAENFLLCAQVSSYKTILLKGLVSKVSKMLVITILLGHTGFCEILSDIKSSQFMNNLSVIYYKSVIFNVWVNSQPCLNIEFHILELPHWFSIHFVKCVYHWNLLVLG